MNLLTDLAIGLALLWTLSCAAAAGVNAWRIHHMGMEERATWIISCDQNHGCPSIVGGNNAECLTIAEALSLGWSVADGRWCCPACQSRPGRMTLSAEHSHEIGGESGTA